MYHSDNMRVKLSKYILSFTEYQRHGYLHSDDNRVRHFPALPVFCHQPKSGRHISTFVADHCQYKSGRLEWPRNSRQTECAPRHRTGEGRRKFAVFCMDCARDKQPRGPFEIQIHLWTF